MELDDACLDHLVDVENLDDSTVADDSAGHGSIQFLKLHFNTHFIFATPLGKLS